MVVKGEGDMGTGSLGSADGNLYIIWINNKVLLYSMKTIFNILINYNGKEYEKEHMVDSLVSEPPGRPHMYV